MAKTSITRSNITRSKLFWVGVLYFAEGFPLGVFYEILPVHFRMQGIDLTEIGFLSLLGLTWSIKFLWAPAIDRYRRHRTWMLVVDVGMASIMLMLAAYSDFGSWMWFAIAFFTLLSATNDIAIDGYTVELLDKHEYGLANGVRIGLYRVGLLTAGALLWAQPLIGWSGVYFCAAIVLVLMGISCRTAPEEPPAAARGPAPAREAGRDPGFASDDLNGTGLTVSAELRLLLHQPLVLAPALLLLAGLVLFALGGPLRQLGLGQAANAMPALSIGLVCLALLVGVVNRHRGVQLDRSELANGPVFGAFLSMSARRYFFPVLLFILTFKLADQTIGFMIKPFWVDAGFSARQIGVVSVQFGIVLSIAGGLAGGWFTDRVGIFRGLWILGLTQIVSNLGYAWIAHVFPLPGVPVEQPLDHQVMMYATSAIESFTQGLGTGAFLAFLMSIVNKRNAATEYAVLSSIFVLARSVAGWAGGYGAETLGYADFFLLTFFFGLPAYLLLPWVRKMLDAANAAADGAAAVADNSARQS
jgi:PAT family beta-lactamase induction signal transducer AmpG